MRIGLWILLVLAVLLAAFNLLRVGVDAEYADETLYLRVKAGPVKLTLLPKKEKPPKPKKEKKKKEKPPKEPKPEEEAKPKRKLSLSTILSLARLALEAVGSFRRKLHVDLFRLHLLVATPDPYNTAMYYAYLRAGLDGLYPLAARTLNIRERDVHVAADFTRESILAEGQLILTIRIGQIVGIALVFACKALVLLLRQRRNKPKPEAPSAERKVSNGQ